MFIKFFNFGKKIYFRINSNFYNNFIKQNSFKILLIYKKNLKAKTFYYELLKLLLNMRFDSKSLIQKKKSNSVHILKRTPLGAGLFSNYMLILEHLFLYPDNEYFVDWKNFKTFYNEKNSILGTKNAFEYYWQQPIESNLKHIYKKRNYYITNDRSDYGKFNFNELNTMLDSDNLKRLHKCALKIPLNKHTDNHIKDTFKNLLKGMNTIGVSHRSTDYTNLQQVGHYVQPTINDLILEVRKFYKLEQFEQIFISSDDYLAIEEFKQNIGLDVPVVSSKRSLVNSNFYGRKYNKNKDLITETSAERENDLYLFGLEYLTDVYLLSKCEYFIGGFTSGSAAVLVLNNDKFKFKYLFNLGRY
jgi:hypothetical protein